MITLLAKIFVKEEYTEARKREIYGVLTGAVGIVLNLLLCAGKMIVGILSGSISILADGMNNLSDAGSSVVTLLGFKLAGQKADHEHPYGHGRMEYVAGLIVSGLIILMAYELIKDSISKILHPEETEFSLALVLVLLVAILVKCYMAAYSHRIGRQLSSPTIGAITKDSLSDCIATLVVLLCAIIGYKTGLRLDGYAGVVVGIFVLLTGISSARDTIDPLLGRIPEDSYMEEIEQMVVDFDPNILGVHDLMVHDYGPGRQIISLHAEVPAEGDFIALHDIIDNCEHMLHKKLQCMATIHMDPVVTSDPRVAELKERVKAIVADLDESLSIHDFRAVFGETHTNLLFDLVIPFHFRMTDVETENEVIWRIKGQMGREYYMIIDIDKR